MRTEYEAMVKEFMPALKAGAAKLMVRRYDMTQMKIAEALQLTQAAVSKYLSGRYSRRVQEIEEKLSEQEVDEFVRNVLWGSAYEAQRSVCGMCSRSLTHRCGLMIK